MAGKILITPNNGSTTLDPTIVFQGTGVSTDVTLRVPSTGGVSFEGTSGQLFSITDSMSGTIYSVNDISGIPSIEVLDTGLVKLAQYSGNVLLGTGTDNGTDKLQVNGSILGTTLKGTTLTSTVATGTAPLTVSSTTTVSNLSADMLDGLHLHTGTNNEANKVVRTDANGYINAGWINTISGDNGTTAISRVYASHDGYIRYYTLANFGSQVAAYVSQITSLGVGTAASGTTGEIRATNNITAYYSDRRLKTEICKIENALDKIDQLYGIVYTQNKLAEDFGYNNYEEQVGLYAQDVYSVLPQAVKPAPFDIAEDGSSKSGENYLTVQYEKLIPLLVEGIKELRIMVEELKNK